MEKNNTETAKTSVVFIVPDIYPCITGGMEIFYFNLIKSLENQIKITLITACSKYNNTAIEVIKIKKRFLGIPGSGRIFFLLKVFLVLFKHKNRIRVIHFPYASNAGKWGYLLPLMSKLWGVKYLMQLHGGRMGKWKFLSGNKSLFMHASELIAVSDIIKNEYESRTARNIKLIYPLVQFTRSVVLKNEIRKTKGFAEIDKIVLFVGSLKTIKVPNTLLLAFKKLGKEFIAENHLKLIFVGNGNLMISLEKEATDYDMKEYVTFTGLIPYEEIPDYYKMADIYVITSKFEGTPKSLLEAMFNKLPIIGSDVVGINNVLSDNVNALLFPLNNADVLCDKIRRLVIEPQLCQELSQNTYNYYVEKYSFKETVKKLNDIYENY